MKKQLDQEVPVAREVVLQSELQKIVQEQLRRLLEKATRSAIDEKDFSRAMQAAKIALLI